MRTVGRTVRDHGQRVESDDGHERGAYRHFGNERTSRVSRYVSPENRSHPNWRVMLSDAPNVAHVAPSALARCTQCARLHSTCVLAEAIRGGSGTHRQGPGSPPTSSSPAAGTGGLLMSWLHRSTHSLRMNTPGPTTTLATATRGRSQHE